MYMRTVIRFLLLIWMIPDVTMEMFEMGVAEYRNTHDSLLMSLIQRKLHNRHNRFSKKASSTLSDEDRTYQKEYQLNSHICPPVLCKDVKPEKNTAAEPVFPFFEGDIVLDETLRKRLETSKMRKNLKIGSRRQIRRVHSGRRRIPSRRPRAIVRPVNRLWKYGIVPFVIDQGLNDEAQSVIRAAIRSYERKTCLHFIPKNGQHQDFIHYVEQPGCWSYVGRKGGEQFVSIGPGCEHFGTVLHETGHALGFWHEQSRLDRDKYVTIVSENISPSAISQFGTRDEAESTSRGFAYDYESIMHYGDRYFTRNGKETIQLKTIGKRLNVKIGQRRHLSDLDIAQINSMYYCNLKDMEDRACGRGWTRNERTCYRFVSNPKLHFTGAADHCKKMKSSLVMINNKKEDLFVRSFLASHYAHINGWRTGGYKNKGNKWLWYFGSPSKIRRMKYTAWNASEPGHHSTLIYALKSKHDREFIWKGAWFGSEKQLPKSGYGFICEKAANITCVSKSTRGQDYRGSLNYTFKGITCQMWSSAYPHNYTVFTGMHYTDVTRNELGDHNYCRNPGATKKRPWCFTTINKTRWQYCDVRLC